MARFAKALVPAAAALIYIAIHIAVTGELDKVQLEAGIAGLVTAAVVYFVPNTPAP